MTSEGVCVTCDPAEPTTEEVKEKNKEEEVNQKEDVLDPSTFAPPSVPSQSPGVIIEYCDRCRWLHRATWVQTELLITFPTPALKSITIIPRNSDETGGRFRVWLSHEQRSTPALIWDRKTQGGFPELKDLKQRIRDIIQPGVSLGHSDRHAIKQT